MLFDPSIAYVVWIVVAVLFGCCGCFCCCIIGDDPREGPIKRRQTELWCTVFLIGCIVVTIGASMFAVHADEMRDVEEDDDGEPVDLERLREFAIAVFSFGIFTICCFAVHAAPHNFDEQNQSAMECKDEGEGHTSCGTDTGSSQMGTDLESPETLTISEEKDQDESMDSVSYDEPHRESYIEGNHEEFIEDNQCELTKENRQLSVIDRLDQGTSLVDQLEW